MNSPFSTAVAQIANGQTFDQWHQTKPAKEQIVKLKKEDRAGLRDKILALFKPEFGLKKAQIAEALKVSPDALTWHIGALVNKGKLVAIGKTSNRIFALPGTTAEKDETKSEKAVTSTPKSKTKAESPAPTEKAQIYIDQAISHLMWKRDSIDAAISALRAL